MSVDHIAASGASSPQFSIAIHSPAQSRPQIAASPARNGPSTAAQRSHPKIDVELACSEDHQAVTISVDLAVGQKVFQNGVQIDENGALGHCLQITPKKKQLRHEPRTRIGCKWDPWQLLNTGTC